MSQPILLALIAIGGTVLGALIAQAAAMFRAPAQARLDDAQAEKAQHESAALVNKELREEIDRLGAKVAALELRVVESERRATSAEGRLADAEFRSSEFRRSVNFIGQRLEKEREESRATTEKLCILIEHLLLCVESPDQATEIDRPGIEAMIANIRNGLPRRQND
jgi:chromosome segregation ATPase